MPHTLTLTDSGFDQEVLKSEVPVLVDFWAEGCQPCRRMAPDIDAVAAEYDSKAKVGKLNVGENSEVAMRYNIRAVPTLLLFHHGQVVEQRVGALPKSELSKLLATHVK